MISYVEKINGGHEDVLLVKIVAKTGFRSKREHIARETEDDRRRWPKLTLSRKKTKMLFEKECGGTNTMVMVSFDDEKKERIRVTLRRHKDKRVNVRERQ